MMTREEYSELRRHMRGVPRIRHICPHINGIDDAKLARRFNVYFEEATKGYFLNDIWTVARTLT